MDKAISEEKEKAPHPKKTGAYKTPTMAATLAATAGGNILTPPLLSRLKLKPPPTSLLSLSPFQSNLFCLRLCISTSNFQSFPLSHSSSSHLVSASGRYSGKSSDDDQPLDISSVRFCSNLLFLCFFLVVVEFYWFIFS